MSSKAKAAAPDPAELDRHADDGGPVPPAEGPDMKFEVMDVGAGVIGRESIKVVFNTGGHDEIVRAAEHEARLAIHDALQAVRDQFLSGPDGKAIEAAEARRAKVDAELRKAERDLAEVNARWSDAVKAGKDDEALNTRRRELQAAVGTHGDKLPVLAQAVADAKEAARPKLRGLLKAKMDELCRAADSRKRLAECEIGRAVAPLLIEWAAAEAGRYKCGNLSVHPDQGGFAAHFGSIN